MYQRYPFKVVADVHSYGELMIWPLGYTEKEVPNIAQFQELWQKTFEKVNFQGGNSIQLLYPTTGTGRDYGYEKHGAISMTLEVGESFRPSFKETEKMWTELSPHLLTLIETAK